MLGCSPLGEKQVKQDYCRLYSNISQILLLYKVWVYYNKFDSIESLVYIADMSMPQSGCVEHGLEYITFYVQEHIAHVGGLFWVPTGSRRAARGTRISETRLLAPFANSKIKALYTFVGLQKFVTIAVCSNKTYVSDENWNVLVDISANTEKPLLFTWFGER